MLKVFSDLFMHSKYMANASIFFSLAEIVIFFIVIQVNIVGPHKDLKNFCGMR